MIFLFLTAAITVGIFSGGSYIARTVTETTGTFGTYKLTLNGKEVFKKGNTEVVIGYETVMDAYHLGLYGFGGFSHWNEEYIKNYKFGGAEFNVGMDIGKSVIGYFGGGAQFAWMQSVKYSLGVTHNDKSVSDAPGYLCKSDAPTAVFTHPFVCAGLRKRYKNYSFELKYRMLFCMTQTVEDAVYQFDKEKSIFQNSMIDKTKIKPKLSFFTNQILIGVRYCFEGMM
ncbi:MAG: hypothetical protein H6850_00860 [Alphaproteobacteria bacterium]|nr:MAG: hypothetical protein H6850_00860 [Alphaproteobacteria bacterium]